MIATIQLFDLAAADEARRFSPFCWRTKMALAHKGLTVETIPWHFTEKAKLAFSGSERVPVIVDNGGAVFDSWTIANYLEDTYPSAPSLFGSGAGREFALFVNTWADTVLNGGLSRFVFVDIWRHLTPADQTYFRASREQRLGTTLEVFTAEREKYLASFRQSLAPMRKTLEVRLFLGGAEPLYPDYIVLGSFQWARAISPFQLLEASDPLYAWRERMLDRFGGLVRNVPAYPV